MRLSVPRHLEPTFSIFPFHKGKICRSNPAGKRAIYIYICIGLPEMEMFDERELELELFEGHRPSPPKKKIAKSGGISGSIQKLR